MQTIPSPKVQKPIQQVGNYLPFASVDWTAFNYDNLVSAVFDSRTGQRMEEREICLVQNARGILGDWIVVFTNDETDGISICEVYAAGRVS